jgi:hypothetical protein
VNKLTGQDLIPDCAGDCVTQCTSNVVSGEVETRDDSEIYELLEKLPAWAEGKTYVHAWKQPEY